MQYIYERRNNMAQTNLTIRIDEDIKREAENLFNKIGLTMSSAINVFFRQALRAQAIPFELKAYEDNFAETKLKREADAWKICQEMFAVHGAAQNIKINLVDMKPITDLNELTFYFTSDGSRIDFTDLIKDMASSLQARIYLYQIGSRESYIRTVCKENFNAMNTDSGLEIKLINVEWQGPQKCDCIIYFTANEQVDIQGWEWLKNMKDDLSRDTNPKTIELRQVNT
jgi:DNA-damage-inducible protein J